MKYHVLIVLVQEKEAERNLKQMEKLELKTWQWLGQAREQAAAGEKRKDRGAGEEDIEVLFSQRKILAGDFRNLPATLADDQKS